MPWLPQDTSRGGPRSQGGLLTLPSRVRRWLSGGIAVGVSGEEFEIISPQMSDDWEAELAPEAEPAPDLAKLDFTCLSELGFPHGPGAAGAGLDFTPEENALLVAGLLPYFDMRDKTKIESIREVAKARKEVGRSLTNNKRNPWSDHETKILINLHYALCLCDIAG